MPAAKTLPASVSDIVFRQAHSVSHQNFSTDVSELIRILRDRAEIKEAKRTVSIKLVYWAASLFLAALIAGISYFSYSHFGTQNPITPQVAIFTHDEGLTPEVAEKLRSSLASSDVRIVVNQHVDRRHPDAIYISESAPVQLVRQVINEVRYGITHIFPIDYSTKSSMEMRGVSIAAGLMSDFEYYAENSAEKPYRISQSQLDWSVEEGLDQATFVDRLNYVAPARKRPKE